MKQIKLLKDTDFCLLFLFVPRFVLGGIVSWNVSFLFQ
jgi:hypothetical protein